ncbi:MAG: IQ calmodulin-binding motif-containing protein [Legionella sp.]|nr:IQ calmodulin-binding motif-containing protein [Legionella sp.]
MGIKFSLFKNKQAVKEESAVAIQSLWRGHKARKDFIKEKSIRDSSVVTIQSLWKGYHIRKEFSFKHFADVGMHSSPTYVVGNDPVIKNLELYVANPHEHVALIGTSGLRALSLICKLAPTQTTPKLIIVDNSTSVVLFWRKFRELVHITPANKVEFLQKFEQFLATNQHLHKIMANDALTVNIAPGVEYENQNSKRFLEHLIDLYDLEFLCRIIKSATIINQSWANKELFCAIKNILNLNGITKTYLYPSNIAHCIATYDADKLLENIQLISPTLSIITDRCPSHSLPEEVYITTKTNKVELRALIFPSAPSNNFSFMGNMNSGQFSRQLEQAMLLTFLENLTNQLGAASTPRF